LGPFFIALILGVKEDKRLQFSPVHHPEDLMGFLKDFIAIQINDFIPISQASFIRVYVIKHFVQALQFKIQ
jgi:hypothetical protein